MYVLFKFIILGCRYTELFFMLLIIICHRFNHDSVKSSFYYLIDQGSYSIACDIIHIHSLDFNTRDYRDIVACVRIEPLSLMKMIRITLNDENYSAFHKCNVFIMKITKRVCKWFLFHKFSNLTKIALLLPLYFFFC